MALPVVSWALLYELIIKAVPPELPSGLYDPRLPSPRTLGCVRLTVKANWGTGIACRMLFRVVCGVLPVPALPTNASYNRPPGRPPRLPFSAGPFWQRHSLLSLPDSCCPCSLDFHGVSYYEVTFNNACIESEYFVLGLAFIFPLMFWREISYFLCSNSGCQDGWVPFLEGVCVRAGKDAAVPLAGKKEAIPMSRRFMHSLFKILLFS